MSTRVCLGLAAAFLLLVSAPASRAQQADSASTAHSGSLPGRGSIGAQVGGSYFIGEKDYSEGAQPRFAFAGLFRYVISPSWRWQVSPMFTWAAYRVGTAAPFPNAQFGNRTIKDFYLTQVVGATGQLQWVHGRKGTLWHLGVGPAVYRVVVQDDRKVVKDPLTKRLHAGSYLGATGELGVERFTKVLPNTSLEWTIACHTAFAQRDDQFPSGFDSKVSVFETRIGAHYYYDFRKPKKPDASPASRH